MATKASSSTSVSSHIGVANVNEVELFNLRHSSLRNVIERIFGDLELVFQTQEQQRHNATEWRVGIALDMWRDAGHNDNNENQG
ncbi:unnamed protein product [Prunus armeniaca]